MSGEPGDPGLLDRLALLIPARDEASSLPLLFEALADGPSPGVVLVVDNGSRDGTAEVARAAGARVVREPVAGYGRACLRGLDALAADRPVPEAVAFLDADDPEAARRLRGLAEPVLGGEADLAVGVRRPRGAGLPLHATWGNRAVAAVLRGLYGAPVHDLGPFRAVRWEALALLGMDDPAFGWNVQMQVRALKAGLRVREVPVEHRGRRRGRSKITGSLEGSTRAAIGMLSTLWREAVRPPGL